MGTKGHTDDSLLHPKPAFLSPENLAESEDEVRLFYLNQLIHTGHAALLLFQTAYPAHLLVLKPASRPQKSSRCCCFLITLTLSVPAVLLLHYADVRFLTCRKVRRVVMQAKLFMRTQNHAHISLRYRREWL